jgi:hypothetical protein
LSTARPNRTLPPGKTRYPLYRRLGGPQGQSGQREISPPPGIRSPDRPARSQSLYRLSYLARGYEQVKKAKCTLVQALRHCTGRTAYRGSRGIAPAFHDHGTRRGEGSASRPGRSLPWKDPVPIVQEAGWAPGPAWTGAQNLTPTGIPSPDRPACSQSLYRLCYQVHGHEEAGSTKCGKFLTRRQTLKL